MKRAILLLASFAASAPGLAAAPEPRVPVARPEEVSIPFARFGAIRNFRTDGDDVIYLQDGQRNWYRAELAGSCLGLPGALRIGFDTRFSAGLDNSSTLIVDGERCPIHSLVRSGEPPRRSRRP